MNIRGVKKVNETIIENGRSLVINEDERSLDMKRIPDGSLRSDPQTGQLYSKLGGNDFFTPLALRMDGSVMPPAEITRYEETYTIKQNDVTTRRFWYEFEGETYEGEITNQGYEFHLKKGFYRRGRGYIHAIINGVKYVDAEASGGLIEADADYFIIKSDLMLGQFLEVGTTISVKYFHAIARGRQKYGPAQLWLDLSGDKDSDENYFNLQEMLEVENHPTFFVDPGTKGEEVALNTAHSLGHRLVIVGDEGESSSTETMTSRFKVTEDETPVFEDNCKIAIVLDEGQLTLLGEDYDDEVSYPAITVDYNVTVVHDNMHVNNDYGYIYRLQSLVGYNGSVKIDIWDVFRYGKDAMNLSVEVRVKDTAAGITKGRFIDGDAVSVIARDSRFIEIFNTFDVDLEFDILIR